MIKRLLSCLFFVIIWAFASFFFVLPPFIEFIYLLLAITVIKGRGWVKQLIARFKYELNNRSIHMSIMFFICFGIAFWIASYVISVYLYSIVEMVYTVSVLWHISAPSIIYMAYYVLFTSVSQEVFFRDILKDITGKYYFATFSAIFMVIFYSGNAFRGNILIFSNSPLISLTALAIISIFCSASYNHGGIISAVLMHGSLFFSYSLMKMDIVWKEDILKWVSGDPLNYGYSPLKATIIFLCSLIIAGVLSLLFLRGVFDFSSGKTLLLSSDIRRTVKVISGNRRIKSKKTAIIIAAVIFSIATPAYMISGMPSFQLTGRPVYVVNHTVSMSMEMHNRIIEIKRPSIEPPSLVIEFDNTKNMTGFYMRSEAIDSQLLGRNNRRPDNILVKVEVHFNGRAGKTMHNIDLGRLVAGENVLYYEITIDDIMKFTGHRYNDIIPDDITTLSIEEASVDRGIRAVDYIKITFTVDHRELGRIQPFDFTCAVKLDVNMYYMSAEKTTYVMGNML